MSRLFLALSLCFLTAGTALAASPPHLVEPQLRLIQSAGSSPEVALTLYACSGATDNRILSALVDNDIPATVFVTARWLRRNAEAFALLTSRPDLFEIENHGENHIPAVDFPTKVYGIAAAGSLAAVEREVTAGADEIAHLGGGAPRWFRGSTARYSPTAITLIRRMGFRVAGYSVNGDGGSLLGARQAEKRIASARDGDVIIAHVNQPTHAAGEGVVRGILALKARGYRFVRLEDAGEAGTDGTAE